MSWNLRRALPLVWLLFLPQAFGQVMRPRITERPDNGVVVRIPGTTHPSIAEATFLGNAPANLPMERMVLQLKSSPAQEAALEQLLVEQQDSSSPRYHAWLTPEQFGEEFGPAPQDIEAITNWLSAQGFQVTGVAAGRRTIEFSGFARQVESAFHTQINRYELNGRQHTANATDISIPAALAPVVSGVASLHDFGVRPQHHVIAPMADFSGGIHGLAPYDFAAIYDVANLWTAGYDGAGQTIAIVGETNIKVSDVTSFRATFGLPVNNPTVVVNGTNPGILTDGEETEADLDVEWAGAVAKGATVKLVVSASTAATDGITLSAQYIVNHAVGSVMSLSYGLCEAQMGSAVQSYSSLWQQAAAEGIAVFVAAGDSGSEGCDPSDSAKPATNGFGVNGLASSAYNVAVGGTEFNDTASPSTYWNASNNTQISSARSYIPEVAWNESSYKSGATTNGLYAGGGGASAIWPRPSWQTGAGVPAGSTRLLPDVSLSAAGHDGYVVEQEGSLYLVGGTSASTPSFAGLMAIINQYTHTANGNPNGKLYALAAQAPAVYHDITSGTNAVPCVGGSLNCSAKAPSTNVGMTTGYTAGAGYDLATGLGSVDAYALVTNWGGAPVAPTIVSLSPNPMTGSASSQSLVITGAGFVAGSTLKVIVGSTVFTGSQIAFASSSQLSVSVNVGGTAQSLPVQVTNPGGTATNVATLTVNPSVVAPVIASIGPTAMTGSNSAQTLTIKGSNFLSGVKVLIGATTLSGSQLASQTPTQIQVNIITGLTSHTYAVQVVNANGGASNSVNLAVNAPPVPAISSLSPNPLTGQAAAQTLTVDGSNFQTGLTVNVGPTAYTGSKVSFVSATQLKVSVTVAAGSKSLSVSVANPSGATSEPVLLTVK